MKQCWLCGWLRWNRVDGYECESLQLVWALCERKYRDTILYTIYVIPYYSGNKLVTLSVAGDGNMFIERNQNAWEMFL